MSETLLLLGISAGVAAYLLVVFVGPFIDSGGEGGLAGRLERLQETLKDRRETRLTAYGSRERTQRVRLVNLVLCGLTALGAVTVALQLAYYPVVGFAMLALLKVPRDAQLHVRASLGDRMNMRLFQAWSWPVHAVHAIKR